LLIPSSCCIIRGRAEQDESGRVRSWSEKGDLQFDSTFEHGKNRHRKNVSYRYLLYLPKEAGHGRAFRRNGANRQEAGGEEPELGHGIHWQVYPGQEIYDWLLRYDRRSRK
jgi:hypothetical protein